MGFMMVFIAWFLSGFFWKIPDWERDIEPSSHRRDPEYRITDLNIGEFPNARIVRKDYCL